MATLEGLEVASPHSLSSLKIKQSSSITGGGAGNLDSERRQCRQQTQNTRSLKIETLFHFVRVTRINISGTSWPVSLHGVHYGAGREETVSEKSEVPEAEFLDPSWIFFFFFLFLAAGGWGSSSCGLPAGEAERETDL